MELFVSDKMMFEEDSGIKLRAYSALVNLAKDKSNVLYGILKSTSAMLGLYPNTESKEKNESAVKYIHRNMEKIFNDTNVFLFCAYPSVTSFVTGEHKGSNLYGKCVKTNQAVMQVYKENNGVRWYISDRPFEDNILTPIMIENRGSGFFRYTGPGAPSGSDYYIEQFKEW
jgi:hypothetical protein|nr:MAG TPA: hypothetical protein [Caudoviricetes sp.]